MFSRAHLLIERDWERLKEDNPWGVEASPLNEDNMFEWTAKVLGLKGSLWEGGIFRLYIKFDERYNTCPPEVCFHTIPFHPNVDMITGKPCIDFLDDWSIWKESYSLTLILLTVQTLLSEPVLENAVNIEAVDMLLYSPHSYKQMVHDCVTASQRVEAGLSPHLPDAKVRFAPPTEELPPPPAGRTPAKSTSHVTFEDYHATWSGIATSKSDPNAPNPLLELIRDKPNLQSTHYGVEIDDLREQMQRQVEDHNTLMYGRFHNKPSEDDIKAAKLEKVNQMKKIYLQPKTPRKTPTIPLDDDLIRQATFGDDEWEEEVDDLVAWTSKLDETKLG